MADEPNERAKPSARDQLRVAHLSMSPEAIREHALVLANSLEAMTEAYNLLVVLARHNLKQAKDALALVSSVQRGTRQAANFATQGPLHLAVDTIKQLAAIELVDPHVKGDLDAYAVVTHEPELFSPKEPA